MKMTLGRNIVVALCLLALAACGGLPSNAAGVTPTVASVSGIVPSATLLAPTETQQPAGVVNATATPAAANLATSTSPAGKAGSSNLVVPGAIMATGTVVAFTPPTGTAQSSALTCASPAALTPAETEGPYFKAGSPENSSLAGSLPGAKLTLTGYVLTADCKPVANALLDFWQADSTGTYDNTGYTLRGHQTTDASGKFQLETVVPGLYPGRTEHIHVKVQAPGGPVLTTQLYFPGVVQNDSDGIFDPRLLMTVQPAGSDFTATFNFVIALK